MKRIDQEDFRQATRTRPDDKYQEDGGPSLARIADIVTAAAILGSVQRLLQAVTLNSLVGNGATHTRRTTRSSTNALECCTSPPL